MGKKGKLKDWVSKVFKLHKETDTDQRPTGNAFQDRMNQGLNDGKSFFVENPQVSRNSYQLQNKQQKDPVKDYRKQKYNENSENQMPKFNSRKEQADPAMPNIQSEDKNNVSQFQIPSLSSKEIKLEQLVQVLNAGQEQDKAKAAEILFNLSAEDQLDKQRLASLGVVEPLIKLLHSDIDHATMYAAYMLSNLTSVEVSRTDMTDFGAIQALIRVLNSNKSLVSKKGAMRALGRLARIQEQALQIVKQGGLNTIIAVLQMDDNSLVRRALIALYFIGADKQQLQAEIASTKAIEILIQLTQSENPDIQAEAFDCIKVLSRNIDCSREILHNNGLQILGDMAKSNSGNNKAKLSANKALQRLSEFKEIQEEVTETVGKLQQIENDSDNDDDNEVQQVAYLMTHKNPNIQIETAQKIAEAAADDPKQTRNYQDQGVIQPLVKMIQHGNIEQRVSAAQALQRLAVDTSVVQQLYKAGIFAKLVLTLKEVQGIKQEGIAVCLDRITQLEGTVDDINEVNGGLNIIMESLSQATSITQYHLASVLLQYCLDYESCRNLIQLGYLSIILRLCWRSKQEVKVVCLTVIQEIISQQPETCQMLIQIGLASVIYHQIEHSQGKIGSLSKNILNEVLQQNSQFQQQVELEQQYQDKIKDLLLKINEQVMRYSPNIKNHGVQSGRITFSGLSPTVDEVFATIPRHIFLNVSQADLTHANRDTYVTTLGIKVPPAYIDAIALEALQIQPHQSVLDVGSGTGFMTAAFSYLTGQKGNVTAAEVSNQACEYAGSRVTYALQSRALTSCSPIILPQNIFLLLQQQNMQKQDRIYVGASCPRAYLPNLLDHLKVGGIMVVPSDGQLLKITKSKNGEQINELCVFDPPGLVLEGQVVPAAKMNSPIKQSVNNYQSASNQKQNDRPSQENGKGAQAHQNNGTTRSGRNSKPSAQQNGAVANGAANNNKDINNNSQPQKGPTLGRTSVGQQRRAKEVEQEAPRSARNHRNVSNQQRERERIDKEIKQGLQEGLLMTTEDIEVVRNQDGKRCKLGEGGFGVVYKAITNGVDEVAVKIVKADNPSPKELELFLKEVKTLSKLRHRNIVQFYGVCLEPGSLFFVMELMKGGDLYTVLRHHPDTMRWDRLGRKVAMDVALGINYLHTRKMMHRDLKSPNVLLSEEGVAKIADVGMVRQQVKDLVTAQPVMTPLWAAPEVMRHEKASIMADIWSYGILIWEIVTGQDITEYQPLGITKLSNQQSNKGKIMALPSNCSPIARKVFEACTQSDAKKRPNAQTIVGWLQEEGV